MGAQNDGIKGPAYEYNGGSLRKFEDLTAGNIERGGMRNLIFSSALNEVCSS